MTKRKIVIDTDGGSDDAMALAMALREPSVEILMIGVVAGNVTLPQACDNVLMTIERSDGAVPPVYAGCGEMLLRDLAGAYETHGSDGMGDHGFKKAYLELSEGHAVLEMLKILKEEEKGSVDLITLGPLTNIALAMRLDPETMRRAGRIVAMGTSGLAPGNVTPLAEFNIWQDAEAAKIVTEFGCDLTYVGWDACCGEAMLDEKEIRMIREGSALGEFLIDANSALMELNVQRFGVPCLDLADPAAMAAYLKPECVRTCSKYYCEVDATPGPSYGAVLVDAYGFGGKEANVSLCTALDPAIFKSYLMDVLGIPGRS